MKEFKTIVCLFVLSMALNSYCLDEVRISYLNEKLSTKKQWGASIMFLFQFREGQKILDQNVFSPRDC